MKTIVITGAAGTAGAHACEHFHALGWQVAGIDLSFPEETRPWDTFAVDVTHTQNGTMA